MATDLSNWTKLEEKDVFQKTESHPYGDAAIEKNKRLILMQIKQQVITQSLQLV